MTLHRPPVEWIEIDHQAHIMNGPHRTYCGLDYTHATLIQAGTMDGCMDCISAFGQRHAEVEITPVPDSGWEL